MKIRIIFVIWIFLFNGCDSPGKYKRYDKKQATHLTTEGKKRAKSFFLETGGNKLWDNKYLIDLKFFLEETSNSVIAVGRKRKVLNSKYTAQQKTYKIEKKCYLDKVFKKPYNKNSTISCIYVNLDEGKEKVIKGDGIILKSSDFAALNEWNDDNFADAMESFLNSCTAFERYRKQRINIASGDLVFGKIQDWVNICKLAIKYRDKQLYKAFFEDHFQPFAAYSSGSNKIGNFTGYYELSLRGSRHRSERYRYPIYKRPPECAKKSTCYTRRELNEGAISNRGLELYWVDDFIELWRLQIQGSGIVEFEDGTYARVGFGSGNGYSYRRFIDYFKHHDVLPPGNHSANFIYQWMRDNPEIGIKAMSYNPAYLFFIPIKNNGQSSRGAQLIPLTPGRSGAVDTDFVPLGMPIWIETKVSVKEDSTGKWINLNRLVVAQDIGSAIKGPIRMDIFFGHGQKARYLAETLKYSGKYYFLLPKRIVEKIKKR